MNSRNPAEITIKALTVLSQERTVLLWFGRCFFFWSNEWIEVILQIRKSWFSCYVSSVNRCYWRISIRELKSIKWRMAWSMEGNRVDRLSKLNWRNFSLKESLMCRKWKLNIVLNLEKSSRRLRRKSTEK